MVKLLYFTGQSFYADPGFDVSWSPLSDAEPLDIAIGVAVSLFALSLLIKVYNFVGSWLFENVFVQYAQHLFSVGHQRREQDRRLVGQRFRQTVFGRDRQGSGQH